jgi:LmbE family N-acetylglucosaminyl deacetylase
VTRITDALGLPTDRGLRCLAIGAHPDDVEIGAGATLMRLGEERPDTELRIVVLTGSEERAAEASASGRSLGAGVARVEVETLGGRDAWLPYDNPAAVKDGLAGFADPAPDIVLVHRRDDAHQDHRFASELAWQLFRRSTILEYEVPKWDGDLGAANFYVTVSRELADSKVAHLLRAFPSQRGRDWFDADAFMAMLRLRGVESRSPSGLAEAFVARKLSV